MLTSERRSSEKDLMKNAKNIAEEFLSRGAEEMIAELTAAEKMEKTH